MSSISFNHYPPVPPPSENMVPDMRKTCNGASIMLHKVCRVLHKKYRKLIIIQLDMNIKECRLNNKKIHKTILQCSQHVRQTHLALPFSALPFPSECRVTANSLRQPFLTYSLNCLLPITFLFSFLISFSSFNSANLFLKFVLSFHMTYGSATICRLLIT